jgi:hypothetical protein
LSQTFSASAVRRNRREFPIGIQVTMRLPHFRTIIASRRARSPRRCVALEPLELRIVPAFTTIVNNGPSANRIDLVFVGDGYTSGDIQAGTYGGHVQTLLDYLFVPGQNVGGNQDPFTRYAKYFNVHRIDVVSAQSGVTTPQNNIVRNTALKSTYRFDGTTDRLLYLDDTVTNNLVTQELTGAGFQPEMRFAVANSTVYGGGGGQWAMYAGGATGATPAFSAVEIALHEVAHSFVDLADEYGGNPAPYTGPEPTEVNVTKDSTGAKWSRWTGYAQQGLSNVGAFNGGRYFDSGIYRPTNASKMNILGNPFDAIARESFVLKFGEFVKPLDGFTANTATLVNPANLSVTPVDTTVIGVDWFVNGNKVSTDAATTMTPAQLGLTNGTFTVRATAYDRAITTLDWVRTRQNTLSQSVEWTVTVGNPPPNTAPTLDPSGSPYAVLGVGSRQSTEMRQGTLVSEILARGANGTTFTDPDANAQRGIAVTGVDHSLGKFQYTLTTTNPAETDWTDVDAAGAISDANALLLPATARLRFSTTRIPHHDTAAPFLNLEAKLATGLTFRAWDVTSGTAGGRASAATNGGGTAFSAASETAAVYFEARLFRAFNANAALNVYTLEAEFNALVAQPGIQDRSTAAFSGFTILLSAVPELGTVPLYRLYYGVQFNANGTETDMGYRYLTSNLGEATSLEGLGPADKRPQRAGSYFRELGVNAGSAILGYIYAAQQPGTAQMTQIYRTDIVNKPTRPGGTAEGSTATSNTPQENGDHVYTTNTTFETSRPGTWRIEAARGFVRELTPNPTGAAPAFSDSQLTTDRSPFPTALDLAIPSDPTAPPAPVIVGLATQSAPVRVGTLERRTTESSDGPPLRRAGIRPDRTTPDAAPLDRLFAKWETTGALGGAF